MYKAEKVINGVLHWKGTPDGEWKPYNLERLTDMLIKEREAHRKTNEDLEELESINKDLLEMDR